MPTRTRPLRTPATDRLPPASAAAVDKARRYIDAHFDRAISLAELAAHTGVSPHHLQRSFQAAVGLSPREYQRARRLARLKSQLREGATVSRATFDAGFGSSSRVYERAAAELGMTPAAYARGGAGARIQYALANTTLGPVLVAATDHGICTVAFADDPKELERSLASEYPRAELVRDDAALAQEVAEVRARAAGESGRSVHLDVHGTEFQGQVWEALQRIPRGETRSYREIAISLGRPTASRAVARACATNRVALLIPCHRVIRGDGELGGYRWGLSRKESLLRAEASSRE